MDKIAERISEVLSKKGITQKELADKAGITQVSLSRYLNGERVPKANILVQISNALGVSCDYLVGIQRKENTEDENIMKLIINTELGGFNFTLSKTSVIYLLNLAQKLEDEGDPKSDINQKDDNVNENIDISQQSVEELTFPPTEETQGTETEITFPEDEPQEDDQDDFETLLREYDQKKKREWNETHQTPGPADGKYKGFLFIKCEHCGETRGFCAKQPISEYKCNECGEKTKLKDLRRMFMDCECGRHSKYYTNETADVITHNCIECGAPVDMMLNSRRTAYTSLGGGYDEKKRRRI